jgi:hypothetical protein
MLGGRQFDDFKANPTFCRIGCGLIAGVAPVYEGYRDRFAGFDFLGQLSDLRPFLLVGSRQDSGQQLAQGIDGQVYFLSFTAFVLIAPGPSAAFRARLQDPPIIGRCTRLRVTTCDLTQQYWQIMH